MAFAGVDGEIKDLLVGALAGLRSPEGMDTAAAIFATMEEPATPAHLRAWHRTTFTNALSRSISWEGSGHWLHQERPAELNAVVLTWIEQLPAC